MSGAYRTLALAASCATGLLGTPGARAAEYAQGIYVLGNRGPLAGVTPPPGFYFESETYYDSGNLGGNRLFQGGGLGLVGYYYTQLTSDSGSGDRIEPFKGRVTSLGAQIGYSFKLGEIPVSTSVRFFREFDIRNRFTGTATYLTISAPLWVAPPKSAQEPEVVVAKN